MSPRVPPWRWDDPLRSLDAVAQMWSAAGLQVIGSGAAVPYHTLFLTLQKLLVGRELTIGLDGSDLRLTVTEFSSPLDPRGVGVGQLGDVRIVAEDVTWERQHFEHVVATLHNAHFRPGVPPVLVAAPVEVQATLGADVLAELLHHAVPAITGELLDDGSVQLRWARRPSLGSIEVDFEVAGSTLWLKPTAVFTGRKRWGLSERVPAYPLPLPDLPQGLLVTDVELAGPALLVTGLVPEWRMELPLRGLEDILNHLSRAGRSVSLAWPAFLKGLP